MSQKILKREEVSPELCWDLSPLFKDDAAFEQLFEEIAPRWEALAAYQGRLSESAATFAEFMEKSETLERDMMRLYNYAHLRHDQDTANSHYAGLQNRVMGLFARCSGYTAFVEPELAVFPKDVFAKFVAEKPELKLYEHHMERKWKAQEHVLTEAEEAILARSGEVMNAASAIFGVLDNADQRYPVIENEKGEKVELTHSNYIPFMENRDRKVREAAFKNYYSVYRQYRNTYASTLSYQMKVDNLNAELRKHKDARAAALFNTDIPEAVHSRLIETINANLPILHRYISLRKKMLKLDELHCYDLHVPIIEDVDYHFEIKEAEALILEAMAPLGPEYRKILERAFNEHWIDYADNQGKRSGAYSSGCYDSPPYILISWKGTLDNLYTLAHELGHSCHSYYTRSCQPPVYGDYGIFLAEIASTTNENLLTQHLLKVEQDPKRRLAILNHFLDGFKSTIFRQTQFAEFEHWMHQEDQAGVPLTADHLMEKYAEINQKYYGPELKQDAEIALEWARIPHFYYNYYVFQYATGFSAATAFAKMILEGGEAERERYLDYLRSGCSAYPIDVLKKAGLDMSTPEPIEKAMQTFDHYLAEVEKLVG